MKRVLLSWSSGKDSGWALNVLGQQADVEVVGLLTTLNEEFQRVAMHGTRRSVLEAQAAAAGLPLWVVPLPWPCSNEIYEQRMAEVCDRAVAEHVDAVAFGDLFLEDVRAYRERQLKPTGLEPLFSLWGIPTSDLARTMIAGGLRARVACVDSKSCRLRSRGGSLTSGFWRICRRGPILARSGGSSIPACMRGRCSQRRCGLRLVKWWIGRGLCLRILWKQVSDGG